MTIEQQQGTVRLLPFLFFLSYSVLLRKHVCDEQACRATARWKFTALPIATSLFVYYGNIPSRSKSQE